MSTNTGGNCRMNTTLRFQALATDYDGTLATHGKVGDDVISALRRFTSSGRKLIMVTGREVRDLKSVFSHLELFTSVVAENGAVLYDPATERERLLCEGASQQVASLLREREVPIFVGRAVIATYDIHERAVREAIDRTGLPLQTILNKGSVMVLPRGVDKITGLRQALDELGLLAENVVGIGDAENDVVLLRGCGCGVAVANALSAVKSCADLVTRGSHGTGVVEVIEELLANDGLSCHRGVRQFFVPE